VTAPVQGGLDRGPTIPSLTRVPILRGDPAEVAVGLRDGHLLLAPGGGFINYQGVLM
jgi:hypothetical protein